MSKLGAGGSTSAAWSLSQGSSVAAAAAAAAAGSWAVTSSITITPPPLTHHHHHQHHHIPAYHHHHNTSSASSSAACSSSNTGSNNYQQPLSSGRVLEFPQFPDSTVSSLSSKLPSSAGGPSTYPAVPAEGFFKASDIFHLDYYDHVPQSGIGSNIASNSSSGHHPYYGIAGCSTTPNSTHPYSEYGGGGTGENIFSDTALQSLSNGPPWTIPTMPYSNSFTIGSCAVAGSGGGSTGSSAENGGTAAPSSSSAAAVGIWSGKGGVNGTGGYLSSISSDYSSGDFYPSDCFNYHFDNNNHCWAQQQSISNQGSSNLYP